MSETRAFEFSVSAPAPETFAWLHGRGEKSGEVVSAAPAECRFSVRWQADSVDGPDSPVVLGFAVAAAGEYASLVTVDVAGETVRPLVVIEHFASALGARMTGLRARPSGFFAPPRTRRDDVLLAAWGSLFVVALTAVVATRDIPPVGGKISTRGALVGIVVPIMLVALGVGLTGGLAVRRGGRWYELLVIGLALGWLASYVVFDVWFNAIDRPTASSPESGDLAMGFGAALAAVPEALILVCGVALGRTPDALAAGIRYLRR
jgi:hypothetical protein